MRALERLGVSALKMEQTVKMDRWVFGQALDTMDNMDGGGDR